MYVRHIFKLILCNTCNTLKQKTPQCNFCLRVTQHAQ